MAKIKMNIDLNPMKEQIIKEAQKELPELLRELIIDDHISRGVSPVKGHGNYKSYSDSYTRDIIKGRYKGKRLSPVDLKLSGKLHNSFYVNFVKKGISIGFRSPTFKYHNDLGAGKSRVIRKMLPNNRGEVFNIYISSSIREKLKSIISKIIRRTPKRR